MRVEVLRTLIADDEPVAGNRLRLICNEIDGVDVVGMAVDGIEALRRIRELSPDLVLLDISMPNLDGIRVAEALARMSAPPAVIFCTAYGGHALAAFDVSAVDYLLKPVSRERLARAIDKARRISNLSETPPPPAPGFLDHLWVPHSGAMLRVQISNVQRIDAERDYVRLTTETASYLLNETMAAIERRLDPQLFVRLRRSVIVRGANIIGIRHEGLGSWSALIGSEGAIRIGPTYLKQVKLRLRP